MRSFGGIVSADVTVIAAGVLLPSSRFLSDMLLCSNRERTRSTISEIGVLVSLELGAGLTGSAVPCTSTSWAAISVCSSAEILRRAKHCAPRQVGLQQSGEGFAGSGALKGIVGDAVDVNRRFFAAGSVHDEYSSLAPTS